MHLGAIANNFVRTTMRNAIRDVMSWKQPILYFTVIATLTSVLIPCYGQIPDASVPMPNNANTNQTIVRSGRLVVGNNFQLRRVGLVVTNDESAASDRIKTQNGSLAFETGYQAEQPASQEWHKLDAKLQHMGPSVQCSNYAMTLRVKGWRAPHFLVDNGDGSPVLPLSRMPSHCGFSVKRSRRDVMFVAPYLGCHVTQQGGNYVLPLRLWGAPMTMSCPVAPPPPPPPSVSCFLSGMVVKLPMATNALKVKVSGVWEGLLSISQQCGLTIEPFFGGVVITAPYTGPCVELEDDEHLLSMLSVAGELTISCPAGLPQTEPVIPGYPPFYQLSQYHFPLYPSRPSFPTAAATTTPKPTHSPKPSSQATHMPPKGYPQVPQMPDFHTFYPYHFPPHPLQKPYFPTSAPTTTTPKPTHSPNPSSQATHMPPKGYPQVPQMPDFHTFYPYHFPPHPPQKPYFPTSAPTTTTPKPTHSPNPSSQATHMPPKGYPQVPQMPDFHTFYPYHFPPHPPQKPYFPTSAPTTTTPKPTHSPNLSSQATHMPPKGYPQVPQMPDFHTFYPYHFPPYPPQKPYFPTSAPTTTTHSPKPATQALHMPPKGDHQVPQKPDFHTFYPYHFPPYPPQQPYFPTSAPTTTTPKQTHSPKPTQALHLPPKGYPQVPLSYQFPQYNFPGFFPQRSVPRAPPTTASQPEKNQNNAQKYHYSAFPYTYRQNSANPPVTATTPPGTTPQAQPKQPFMQYDQYPMVRSWYPYASAPFPPHYGMAPYHDQGSKE
ncbi:adhesive plaque matrix protein [Coregonus clupeaformis]|uniref:adhesive plaque matrix protein n=1 Tax=Coregonus clupeaformis TaxID=59861 RepID=UPI001E1C33BC|nr:adhesive plaque matrix protein [Coregonus clupeaformis]